MKKLILSLSIIVFISFSAFSQIEIDSSGNVGVGTLTPTAKMDINGTLRVRVKQQQNEERYMVCDSLGNVYWRNLPVTVPASGGGFTSMQVFTANGTFNVPAGVTNIMVEVWGGGGGGASGDGTGTVRGCGGMGGGYGKSYLSVTPSSTHAVVIGAGGLGAPGGPCSPGSTGGSSTFGTPVLVTSTGGEGGNGCGSNNTRNGGTSTATLSMIGAKGPDAQTNGRHYGGLSGNGSTIGQGGIGDSQFFGRPGEPGTVVVHW